MRIDLYVHIVENKPSTAELLKEIQSMRAELIAALAELQQATADEATKLDSIVTYIKGVPNVVAEAVAEALAAANVEEGQAAQLIDAARTTTVAKVEEAIAAVSANTAPTDTGEQGGGSPPPPPADQPV